MPRPLPTMNHTLDRSVPPLPGPAPLVRPGGHHAAVLPNGLRVVVVEDHRIPVVSAQLRFQIPPVCQGERTGYVDLVADLLAAGTHGLTKAQIDERTDRLGAQLHAYSHGLFTTALTRHFSQMLDLMGEAATGATFPEEELVKARTRLLANIEARAEEPDAVADTVGHALAFGKDHPYGEVATTDSVSAIDREMPWAWYRHFHRPDQGCLVLVGDLTKDQGMELARSVFGAWKSSGPVSAADAQGVHRVPGLGDLKEAPARIPVGLPRTALVDRPGSPQSVLRMLFPTELDPKDPLAMAAQVLNTILGGAVFNARLMQNLREDKGWTYGVHSSLEPDRWAGLFSAGCSVKNAVAHLALAEMAKEVRSMTDALVDDGELNLAKRYMAGSFARSLESPRTLARFALNIWLNDLPADHYDTWLQRLAAVTKGDVLHAAQRFLHPEQAVLLAVGDAAQLQEGLATMASNGRVERFDADGGALG